MFPRYNRVVAGVSFILCVCVWLNNIQLYGHTFVYLFAS